MTRYGGEMKAIKIVASITACLFLLAASCSASIQRIGAGLYAYVSTNDASANSVFLVSESGILVVDTGLNAAEGIVLLNEIRKISDAPVRWIVNTHYHPDHRGGNFAVGPRAVIISTAYTRDKVTHDDPQQYALNITVRQELTLWVGGHEVRIFHPGPAHTMGDLMVYFPDQQAIATGDLFLTNSCPAMDEGDMENWIVALGGVLGLPVEHIVPGHFAVATKNDLRHFYNYLSDLREQVLAMHRRGLTVEQVKQQVALPAYAYFRQFPKYQATFADNAEAYYHQLEQRKQRLRRRER
ncbi:MAG TPA: MBL fold metallo-hydrolase [Candidatus Angelobacter sp.]